MRWRRFFQRKHTDAELQREIELHMEEEIAENVERGMSAEEARRQAYLKFGNVQQIREEVWRKNSWVGMENLFRDLKHVLRRLKNEPTAVITVAISLGLGIAANVVIFSGVNKMLLQRPPVGDPATLVEIFSTALHGQRVHATAWQVYEALHTQARSFSGVAAFTEFLQGTLTGDGEPERVWGQSTTTNFFDVAQVPMRLGRGFTNNEEYSPVIVLGYGLWRQSFHGDKAIVGKTVTISGRTFTVVGVTAPGFRGMIRIIDARFWIPLAERGELAPEQITDPTIPNLNVIARTKPGVTRTEAAAELDTLGKQISANDAKLYPGLGFVMEDAGSLAGPAVQRLELLLAALTAVALLVLCIAGSNVANLLLARAAARHREMAVRIALGATRWQLIRPMLLESALLAVGGGVFGVLVTLVGLRALQGFHIPVPLPIDTSLDVDWRVTLYAFLLSVGIGLLCGIGPAFAATHPIVPNALKGESTLERPGRKWNVRNVLVVVQIAACLVLLCTTGLYLHSLANASGMDPGFRTHGVFMMAIDPVHNGYKAEEAPLLLRRVRERVAGLPGVVSASWADTVPLSMDGSADSFHPAGRAADAEHDPRSDVYNVSPGYFDTMGIALLAGRDMNSVDPNTPKQAVVNEMFAKKMFGTGNAVGERVSGRQSTYEIVGVVKNSRSEFMAEENLPILYAGLEQNIGAGSASPLLGYSLMVHYEGNMAELAAAMRKEIHAIDPKLAVFNEKEMKEHIDDALIIPRVESAVFGTFGLAGLLLAAVGLYGLMSYSVQRRTHEIGIRLALGATRSGVQTLVVKQGMTLAVIALVIGAPLALAASKIAAKLQYGVSAYDAVTFTCVPIFLAAIALVACCIPAQRAATIEPQTALRHE
jgi:predicted permease